MVTLKELCTFLEKLLLASPITDYCPNGLQIEGKKEVGRLMTAVSANLETIQAAVDEKVDALFVHHGLFWSGDSYVIQGVKREKIDLLLKNRISLIGYHLPLDIHRELGNNWLAALEMGWENLQPFGMMNGIPIGVKGTFSKQSRDHLQQKLESYYVHKAHTALGGKETVQTAALVSGGAYKLIQEAINHGVDCFITGNFDEPAWHQAYEGKINFYALGHAATEKVGPRAVGEYLRKQFAIEVVFKEDRNPF
jgi:dinuclear metal center YbgI/SA1388 family protein